MGDILELEESDFVGFIDDNEIYTAEVVSVAKRTKPFKDDDDNEIIKYEFKFRIISDDQFDGFEVWGETGTKLINNPNCKLLAWSQTLLGRKIVVGYRFDIDDLAGRKCRIQIGKSEKTQENGLTKTRNWVREIMPTREAMAGIANTTTVHDIEEPF